MQNFEKDFWKVVVDCLVVFHALELSNAKKIASTFYKELKNLNLNLDFDAIIYHTEPFDIACDLAGKQLEYDKYNKEYEILCKKHNW